MKRPSEYSIIATAVAALSLGLLFLIIQPIHSLKYNFSIVGFIFSLFFVVLYAARRSGIAMAIILAIAGLPFLILLNRSEIDKNELREIYLDQVASFHMAPYVWGGENWQGIDCSGLPRKSMINALVIYGIENFNGKAVSHASFLWWHDASALEMLGGYRGNTTVISNIYTINAGNSQMDPGDMAITESGVHVMVYLKSDEIIQADPGWGSVVIDKLPMKKSWYDEKVKLVKWTILQ